MRRREAVQIDKAGMGWGAKKGKLTKKVQRCISWVCLGPFTNNEFKTKGIIDISFITNHNNEFKVFLDLTERIPFHYVLVKIWKSKVP